MNDILFLIGTAIVIGLSYYLGRKDGLNCNLKTEMKTYLMSLTKSKMTADYFERCAINETKQFLKFLGVKYPKNKFIKLPKKLTLEDLEN